MPYFMNVIVLMNVSFIKKGQTVGRNRIKREEEGSRKKNTQAFVTVVFMGEGTPHKVV